MGQRVVVGRPAVRWPVAGLVVIIVLAPGLRDASTAGALAAPDAQLEASAQAAVDRDDEDEAAAEAEAEALLLARKQATKAAKQALARARDGEASARSAGRTADRRVRDAEEETVPVVLDRLDAEQRLTSAQDAVRRAQRRLAVAEHVVVERRVQVEAARRDLDAARLEFEDRVVRAYKAGSMASGATFAMTLVREVGSPGELATTLKHLETLALVGDDKLRDAVDGVQAAEAAVDDALDRQSAAEEAVARDVEQVESAIDALQGSDEAVVDAEARATAAREAAGVAEGKLLAAVARRLAAEAALAEAREDMAAAAADASDVDSADASVDTDASVDADASVDTDVSASSSSRRADPPESDDDADLDERQGWLTARERALQRSRLLPEDRRRTADSWVCPVEGAHFINDWGFPRSSDRRHEGTDVFAPLGTEIRAPVAGEVVRTDRTDRFDGRRDLGGITVTVETGDQRFYFAHLDRIHPDVAAGQDVAAGDVVGFVGRTGNARGTPPHLHLGWYVDQVPVNPYPSLAVACNPRR